MSPLADLYKHLAVDGLAIVWAEDLRTELLAGDEAVVRLDNLTIEGKLDLSRCCVKRSLEIKNCRFLGEVDLTYSEFEQAVEFTGCEFLGRFNCGDLTRSHTVFQKDLICNRSVFHAAVGFNGARFEGSAYFNEARFMCAVVTPPSDQVAIVDFTGASCGNTFECAGAVFSGGASFNDLRCRNGIFTGARFKHKGAEIDFSMANFAVALHCERSTPGDDATTFRGGLDLTGVQCPGRALFNEARFENRQLTVKFCDASFGWLLDYSGAYFAGPVSFRGLTCKGDALFNGVLFDNRWTVDGDQDGAVAEVDFRYADFSRDLRFCGVHAKGSVDLGQSHIGQKLHLDALYDGDVVRKRTRFDGDLKLYGASIGTLVLASRGHLQDGERNGAGTVTLPFRQEALDLVGCSFQRFHAGPPKCEWEWTRAFLQAQAPRHFSRDPYLEMEKFYRSQGNRERAEKIHILGHQALHANARDANGATTWTFWQRSKDRVLGWTGWGLKLWRLFIPCFVFIVIGIWWLLPTVPEGQSAPSLIDRVAYSVDLFLPLTMGYSDDWHPAQGWNEAYALVHQLVAWVLIPVAVLAISGLFEKND